MRPSRTIDLSTGLFVLLGFAAILFLVTQITNREFSLRGDSYRLKAQFENIGGLKSGAPVSMAGVTVGRVEEHLTTTWTLFKAVVDAAHRRALQPDTEGQRCQHLHRRPARRPVRRHHAGRFGGVRSQDGDRIDFVQDAIVLENLISKYLFNAASEKANSSSATQPAPAGQE